MPALHARIKQITTLIRKLFPDAPIKLEKAIEYQDGFYLRLRATVAPQAYIAVRELWKQGKLTDYAYQLVIRGTHALRYDNAPHHPELPTFPHHKHTTHKVEPLPNPNLENFLNETQQLLKKKEHQRANPPHKPKHSHPNQHTTKPNQPIQPTPLDLAALALATTLEKIHKANNSAKKPSFMNTKTETHTGT